MKPRITVAEARAWAQAALPKVEEARAGGATTLQEIADALNAHGVPALRGGRWASMQVWRLLLRHGPPGAVATRR